MLKFLVENRFLKTLEPVEKYTSVVETTHAGRSVVANRVIEAGSLLGVYPGAVRGVEEFLEKEEFSLRSMKAASEFLKIKSSILLISLELSLIRQN